MNIIGPDQQPTTLSIEFVFKIGLVPLILLMTQVRAERKN